MECPLCHTVLPDYAAFCPRCGGCLDGATECCDYCYAAFISYRHLPLDAQVAKQVQHAIETFRMPRGAAGTAFPGWPHSGKTLGNCFRDQDELAATHSLPESIRQALVQSRSLIVVCSPQTKESPWVRQEIEMFAQLHGRERIVCVLASGTSEESIPPLLRTRLLPDTAGVMREMPAQPLAADLRSPSKPQRKLELLRTIAAVTGCNFDDLRQRQRARKRRRIAIASAAAAALVALIATLANATASSTRDALIAESKNLAMASQEQFAHGDRIAAIETALSALPASESDWSRPLVPEAKEALKQALLIKTSSSAAWTPLYNVESEGPVVQFREIGGALVATLDGKGTINLYSVWDGAHYLSIDLASYIGDNDAFNHGEYRMETTSNGCIIVRGNTPDSPLLCFEAVMGTLLWRLDKTPANALSILQDERLCAIAGFSGSAIDCKLIDLQTGDVIGETSVSDCEIAPKKWLESFIGPTNHSLFVGVGSFLLWTNFDLEDNPAVLLPSNCLTNIKGIWEYEAPDGTLSLVTLSYDLEGTDGIPGFQSPYQLWVSSGDETQWVQSGVCSMNVTGPNKQWHLLLGTPRIRGFLGSENPAVVCTMGRQIAVHSLATGELTHSAELSSIIVGFDIMTIVNEDTDSELSTLLTATADGTLDIRRADEHQELLGFANQASTGFYLKKALFVRPREGAVIALVQPIEEEETLIAYALHRSTEDDSDVSLDDLIERANDVLERHYGFELDGPPHPL